MISIDVLSVPLLTPYCFNSGKCYIAHPAIDCVKSNGAETCHPYFLKLWAPLITQCITHLLNLIITLHTIPRAQKTVFVLPLCKGVDKGDLNNYHPVSKVSCLATILLNKVIFICSLSFPLIHIQSAAYLRAALWTQHTWMGRGSIEDLCSKAKLTWTSVSECSLILTSRTYKGKCVTKDLFRLPGQIHFCHI